MARSPPGRIRTEGGYAIQGTLTHRVKIVDAQTGAWLWKRLADVAPGDLLPLQMGSSPLASRGACRFPCSIRPTTSATGTSMCPMK